MLKSKWFISVVVILIIIAGGFWYFTSSNSEEKIQYRFVKVDKGDLMSIVSSTGTLNAVTTVQVGSQISGTVSKIFVDFNDRVKAGQVLAVIDTTFLAASVRDAQSTYQKALAQLELSESDFKRADGLYKKNLASSSDFDQAKYNLKNAKTQVSSAQANLDRAKINLKYATIKTPISGTVIARNVDVGQTVAASLSAPTLFLIANDLSKMQILANVDESDIGQIKDGCKVHFTVQAYPNKKFEGIASQIRLQPTTIQNVVNYTVVVNVNNDQGLLLPGMTATLDFLLESASDVFKVPNSALRFKATPEMVAEVKPQLEAQLKNLPDSLRKRILARLEGGGSRSQGSGGGSGFGQSFGGAGGATNAQHKSGMIWYLDNGKLKVARVKVGISDGQQTEISSDDNVLTQGMEVINGVIEKESSKTTSPLQQTPAGGTGMGRRF